MQPSRQLTRRQTLKFLGGAAFATVPALRLAGDAAAGRSWCRTDPVVKLTYGALFQNLGIVVGSWDAMHEAATGPIRVLVEVPKGVSPTLLGTNQGFNHYGYDVSFATAGDLATTRKRIQVRVSAVAPANRDDLDVVLTLIPRGGDALLASGGELAGWPNQTLVVTTAAPTGK